MFIFPIVLTAIGMEVTLRHLPNDYKYKREYLDIYSDEIQTLILGSSHSFYGMDPAYFSSNTFNAANISQSLDFDFEILSKYQNRLEKLETVVLSISYSTLFGKLETDSESWRIKNYLMYYGIGTPLSITDFSEIFSNRLSVNLRRLASYYIMGNSGITCSKLGWGTNYKSEKSS
ncbi:MAG: hypothetical protein IPL46_34655 [Saprospiraceae bacterium]|nr:hypothetical protein [Saprospiraceae bacterium]